MVGTVKRAVDDDRWCVELEHGAKELSLKLANLKIVARTESAANSPGDDGARDPGRLELMSKTFESKTGMSDRQVALLELLAKHNAGGASVIDALAKVSCKTVADLTSMKEEDVEKMQLPKLDATKLKECLAAAQKSAMMLMVAIEKGHNGMAEQLIKAKANVNARNKDGRMALHLACCKGDRRMVGQLIQAKADVNVEDSGKSCLCVAILFGQSNSGCCDIVKQLIEAHADVNAKQSHDGCPPMISVISGQIMGLDMDVVKHLTKLLIEAKADVNAANEEGVSALMHASDYGSVVDHLIEAHANVNAKSEAGNTPLMFACSSGHGDLAQQLIKAGADVNAKNRNGLTAVMLATDRGHESVLKQLIEHGATV